MNSIEHLMVCLNEEAGEVGKEVCKCLRFGLLDVNFLQPKGPTNQQRLIDELNDLEAVVQMLVSFKVLPRKWRDKKKQAAKIMKVMDCMGYAQKKGALETDAAACRRCGCTQTTPCLTFDGACSWAEKDLCSACLTLAERRRWRDGDTKPSKGRK